MQLSVNLKTKNYTLKHNNQELVLGLYPQQRNVSSGESDSEAVDPNSQLGEINGYFKSLSDGEQDALFDAYYSAVGIITSERIDIEVITRVTAVFTSMINTHFDLEDVATYMHTWDISYPSSVHATYESDSTRKPRETTYIKSEYFDLACIALVCHGMAPLWTLLGQSLSGIDRNDILSRDSTILRTLSGTRFISSHQINRLYEFIVYLVENLDDKLKLSVKVDGSGTEGIPPFLLATILINKLSSCNITAFDNKNLIVTVHTSVSSELKKYSNQRSNVRERSDTRMSDEEDKIGFLESYSTRQKVSDDIYIVNDIYLSNYRQVKNDLDPDIPNELVKVCMDSLDKHYPRIIDKHQVTLVQWCLARSIHIDEDGNRRRLIMPRAVDHIGREGIIAALAVTQAALIYWKFPKIARYISSVGREQDDDTLLLGTVDNPIAVTADIKELLARTHPYMRPQGSKSAHAQNMALISVDAYCLMLENRDWYLECTDALADLLDLDPGIFDTDIHIKHDLAKLIAYVAR